MLQLSDSPDLSQQLDSVRRNLQHRDEQLLTQGKIIAHWKGRALAAEKLLQKLEKKSNGKSEPTLSSHPDSTEAPDDTLEGLEAYL
jgi:hypothetical protein